MDIARLVEARQGSILTCTTATGVTEAARLLAEHRIGALPVLDGEAVVGIFSERDLLYAIAREGSAALARNVGEVMTAPAISVERGSTALEALGLMTRRRVRHLPVIENGRLAGFISIGDLVKLRVEQAEADAEAMREYIQTA